MLPTIKKIKVNTIISKSNLPVSDFSINPYVGCIHACKYCYACFMKRFSKHAERWGEFTDVKYWNKIKFPEKYSGKTFFMSSVTDPYNPLEAVYKRSRKFLEEFQNIEINLFIQTKSDLVLRDVDLLKKFKNVRIGFSINTLDETFKTDMDKAVNIQKRLTAMKLLKDMKIHTTCFISPIFPMITDVLEIIEAVKNYCNLIWLENLNLRGSYKNTILNYIKNKFPKLYPLYEEIYLKKDLNYWYQLDSGIQNYAEKKGMDYFYNCDDMQRKIDEPPAIINFFFHDKIKKSARNTKGI